MYDYIISTTSTADITPEYAAAHDFKTLEYHYYMEDKEYADDYGKTMSYKDFYNKLREGIMASTSLINIEKYKEYFGEILKEGKDIVHLEFSSGLSGSAAQAIAAAEEINKTSANKVYVIDTLCACRGQALMTHYALEMRENGSSAEEVVKWVEDHKLNMAHWFTVDDLNHLKRGGRVSNIAAFVGTLVQIKPIMNMDRKGRLAPLFKVRGRKKAIMGLVEKMKSDIKDPEGQMVYICQGDCMEDAEYLKSLILQELPMVKDVQIGYVGPVIGAHSGPGTLAVFYLAENRYEAK